MTALAGGSMAASVDPPVVNTLPSGKIVRLCKTREKRIGAVERQAGEAAVISNTDVAEIGKPAPSSHVPPIRTTFPGRYIADNPSVLVLGSIIVQVWVLRSRTREGIEYAVEVATCEVPTTNTRPSGRTNERGK